MDHLLRGTGIAFAALLLGACGSRQGMSAEAVRGGKLFASSGCLTCHTYRGAGALNLGARDLTHAGRRRKSSGVLARYIANPPAFGNTVMPAYSQAFSPKQLHELAAFLSESR